MADEANERERKTGVLSNATTIEEIVPNDAHADHQLGAATETMAQPRFEVEDGALRQEGSIGTAGATDDGMSNNGGLGS